MSPAELVASLPGGTRVSVLIGGEGMTVDELRAALADSGPVYITTAEAARRYSYTPETWARWAKDMPGAYRDRLWRLPVRACEAHIARLALPTRRKRGPWSASASAPAARSRPPHLQVR